MGLSRKIKDALKEVLEDVEYKGQPAFVAVKGSPDDEFDGYPSIRVLPGDQASERSTQSQNDQTVRYIVRTHVEYGSDSEAAFDHMYDLTDLIIDTLNEADFANKLQEIDEDIPTFMMNADRGDWFDSDTQAGVVLMCDVNVEVTYSKDL